MSSTKGRSGIAKRERPKKHRRKNNNIFRRDKKSILNPSQKDHIKRPSFPVSKYRKLIINTSSQDYVETYLKALEQSLKIYLKTKDNPSPNLLTQIQRQSKELEQNLEDYSLNPRFKEKAQNTYKLIKDKLDRNEFYTQLQELEKRCKQEGLKKNPETNHYPLIRYEDYTRERTTGRFSQYKRFF